MYHSNQHPRRTVIWSIRLLSGLLFGIPALHAEVPEATQQYALKDLLTAAIAHSPELEAQHAAVELGKIKESDIPWWDTPEIRFGYGRDTNVSSEYRSSEYPNHEYDASVRVYPHNPWERKATRLKLQSETRLSELTLQANEQALSNAIKATYWEFSYLSAEAELQEQMVTIYQKQAKGTEKLLQNGQITLSQSLPAKMKQMDASLRMNEYKSQLAQLRDELAQLTGVKAQFIRPAKTHDLSAASFDLPYTTWLQAAMEHRIELKQYDDSIQHTQAELKELRAKNLPWIKHLQANYEVSNDYGAQDAAGVEIAITLPFFVSDSGAKQAALVSLSSQRRQRSAYAGQIRSEVHALVNQFRNLQEAWTAVQDGMGPLREELAKSIEQMQAQQLESSPNYWEAQLALLNISKQELELKHHYQALRLQAALILGETR
jgi:outer membrane protein TolC